MLGSTRRNTSKITAFIFLSFFTIIWIVPVLWVLLSSFKVESENIAAGFMFFPKTWTLSNYSEYLFKRNTQYPIMKWYLNSIIVSISHTVLSVVIYSMSAYAYAKMKFKGRDVIFLILMVLSTFPQIVNIIPLYMLCMKIGWINQMWSLIVPMAANVFYIFLIRQFMYNIPDSMLEAARIDGAGEVRIFTSMILPSSKPILMVVALFSFLRGWNDFLWPSIAINNVEKLTLTPGIQIIRNADTAQVAHLSTVAILAILPLVIIYLFTQRYFNEGVAISASIKG